MTQGDLYNIEFKINSIDVLCNNDNGAPYLGFKNFSTRHKVAINKNIKTAKSYIKS
jgi:hypothetical protein